MSYDYYFTEEYLNSVIKTKKTNNVLDKCII